jgi:hypothetical protein
MPAAGFAAASASICCEQPRPHSIERSNQLTKAIEEISGQISLRSIRETTGSGRFCGCAPQREIGRRRQTRCRPREPITTGRMTSRSNTSTAAIASPGSETGSGKWQDSCSAIWGRGSIRLPQTSWPGKCAKRVFAPGDPAIHALLRDTRKVRRGSPGQAR